MTMARKVIAMTKPAGIGIHTSDSEIIMHYVYWILYWMEHKLES